MWPALHRGLNNQKNLKELLNKIKEMMFYPGYKKVQRCWVLVAEGSNWVLGHGGGKAHNCWVLVGGPNTQLGPTPSRPNIHMGPAPGRT